MAPCLLCPIHATEDTVVIVDDLLATKLHREDAVKFIKPPGLMYREITVCTVELGGAAPNPDILEAQEELEFLIRIASLESGPLGDKKGRVCVRLGEGSITMPQLSPGP